MATKWLRKAQAESVLPLSAAGSGAEYTESVAVWLRKHAVD